MYVDTEVKSKIKLSSKAYEIKKANRLAGLKGQTFKIKPKSKVDEIGKNIRNKKIKFYEYKRTKVSSKQASESNIRNNINDKTNVAKYMFGVADSTAKSLVDNKDYDGNVGQESSDKIAEASEKIYRFAKETRGYFKEHNKEQATVSDKNHRFATEKSNNFASDKKLANTKTSEELKRNAYVKQQQVKQYVASKTAKTGTSVATSTATTSATATATGTVTKSAVATTTKGGCAVAGGVGCLAVGFVFLIIIVVIMGVISFPFSFTTKFDKEKQEYVHEEMKEKDVIAKYHALMTKTVNMGNEEILGYCDTDGEFANDQRLKTLMSESEFESYIDYKADYAKYQAFGLVDVGELPPTEKPSDKFNTDAHFEEYNSPDYEGPIYEGAKWSEETEATEIPYDLLYNEMLAYLVTVNYRATTEGGNAVYITDETVEYNYLGAIFWELNISESTDYCQGCKTRPKEITVTDEETGESHLATVQETYCPGHIWNILHLRLDFDMERVLKETFGVPEPIEGEIPMTDEEIKEAEKKEKEYLEFYKDTLKEINKIK